MNQRQKDDDKAILYRKGIRPVKLHLKHAGYDTETSNNNQVTDLAAFYVSEDLQIQSTDLNEIKKEFCRDKYRGYKIGCHNLEFDFNATFKGDEVKEWHCLRNNGRLLSAWSYAYDRDDGFHYNKPKDDRCFWKIIFIDTGNYFRGKLEKIGRIVGVNKKKWDFSWDVKDHYDLFKEYNMTDAKICKLFLDLLAKTVFELGGRLKLTIGSTAENIFRSNYLPQTFKQQSIEEMDFIRKSFKGGRTEVFKTGLIQQKVYCYDFCSLYPSVMQENDYPIPDSANFIEEGDIDLFNKFQFGFLECDVYVPETQYPPLPYTSKDGKLLFPFGDCLHSIWSFIELKYALALGCKIIKMGKMMYYTESMSIYKEWVDDLFAIRSKYDGNDPRNHIIKLLLNNLFGKHIQRYTDVVNYIHKSNVDNDFLAKFECEEIGDYFSYKESRKPAVFCVPCWSAHVTSFGRIKLHKKLIDHDSIGCDTDSSWTTKKYPESKKLGEMKLEYETDKALFIRPKCYAVDFKIRREHIIKEMKENNISQAEIDEKLLELGKSEVKCKGINSITNFTHMQNLLNDSDDKYITLDFECWIKFLSSLKRNLKINQVLKTTKRLNLEDDKRSWPEPFSHTKLRDSRPLKIIDGVAYNIYELEKIEKEKNRIKYDYFKT